VSGRGFAAEGCAEARIGSDHPGSPQNGAAVLRGTLIGLCRRPHLGHDSADPACREGDDDA
jgi:hypothetical protein